MDIPAHHLCADECEGCPFGGPKVGSKGNPKAEIVFVAESPGYQEVKGKIPLIGPSGQIFHQFVPDSDEVYILNAMECSPNRNKKDEKSLGLAAQCCHARLMEKIEAHPRRLVVAMGNPAVRSLTGDYGLKITQIRGKLIDSPIATLGILPVVHIAALMRGTGSFRQWKEDVTYAMELGRGASPKEYIEAEVICPRPNSQEAMDRLFKRITKNNKDLELTADIETGGFDYFNDEILCLGVTPSGQPDKSWCFYPKHFKYLKKHLERKDISWAWHNGKFDIQFLHVAGIEARVDDDTMLMSYTLDETGAIHDLEQVAGDVLGAPDYKHMLKPYLPNKKSSYRLVPPEVLSQYQAYDTGNTAQIRSIYRARVQKDPDLEKLYTRTLIPASALLTRIEMNGFYIDQQRLNENDVYFGDIMDRVGAEINEMIGYNVNPNSHPDMKDLLFKRMRLPNLKKGSCDKDVLDKLYERTEHPVLRLIREYRGASKNRGTYVKGIRKWINPVTLRVHTILQLHRTLTGRLSSKEPNIQNPPRDKQVRGTYVAAPGCFLVEVDLKQAELCSLAALSGDPLLVEIYTSGGDLHTDLAVFLFPGWIERQITDPVLAYEQRVKCKNVNFGIIYGITPFGLFDQIGGSIEECKRLIDGWYDRYPVAGAFIQACRNTVKGNQIITTCFGRKKRVGLVSRENLPFLENEAANFPHQSIASDITLHTAIECEPTLRRWGIKIVDLVHDSVIMEVPMVTHYTGVTHEAAQLVADAMERIPTEWGLTAVPFRADKEIGVRWGSLEALAA